MRTGLWDRQGANIASRYKEMYGVELFLRYVLIRLAVEKDLSPAALVAGLASINLQITMTWSINCRSIGCRSWTSLKMS